MNSATALSVGTDLAIGLVGFLSIIFGRRAAAAAQAADLQTRNTGNGFANEVRESLSRIEDHVLLLDKRMTGLEQRNRRKDGAQQKRARQEGQP